MSSSSRPQYTFGDTPVAAQRLLLVGWVFEAPSRAFLAEAVLRPPGVALDLGCGPGVTTRLVADVTRARRAVGIDTSEPFLELAGTDAPGGVEFAHHDATELPLPGAPVDLIYCRLLLAHLPDPGATVAAWATQLRAGGRVLVDEVEWIETSHPVLATYEEVVLGLVRSRGGLMYAGPIVDALHEGPGFLQCSSIVREVAVATADAARMYSMNLATWRDDPHVRETHPVEMIDRLAQDLEALTRSPGASEITWGVRQVAYERTGP